MVTKPAPRQRIRFCSTPAGRVAYSGIGHGPLLICDTGWVSHLEKMLEIEWSRSFFTALAERFHVVRYDKPGCGLSDRTGIDPTFGAQVRTLAAIADELRASRFHLFGASQGGQVAVALAAREPKRVDRLVLYGTCARGQELAPAPVRDSLLALVRAHWGLGSKALSSIFLPDASAQDGRDFTELQRTAATADVAAEILGEYYQTDVTSLMQHIQASTLVLHRDGDRATPFELGREVAALIPNATFVPLRGRAHLFWKDDWRAIVDAIFDFLQEPQHPAAVLTARETEVAALVAEGLTNQEIALRLSVATRTVETHLENIREKLGFRSRAQVAAWVTAQNARTPGYT
jgi:pimeloyl-ACP methyl ester carboxylesterase/DNA-binding CsgD family transcriptional regulator